MPAVIDVLSDLVWAERAGDDRGDNRMGERELEGRRCEGDPVGRTHSLDFRDAIDLLGRGVPVVVLGARYRTRRGDPGVENASHHHADAGTLTVRKLLL